MPVVTALAFRIQDEYNTLVSATNDENGDVAEQAFVVGELLRLALNLDYADEIGRRKMFQLARMSFFSRSEDGSAHMTSRGDDIARPSTRIAHS